MYYLNNKRLLVMGFLTLFIISCAGPKSSLPDFFLNPPTSSDYLYGVGNAKNKISVFNIDSNVPIPPFLYLSYPMNCIPLFLKLLHIAPPTNPSPIIPVIIL